MNKQLELTELALVIFAPNYDPTLLNPGFLRYSGIVPHDWQLAQQPVSSRQGSQIIYSNGVNIIAQPNRFIFAENLANVNLENINSPQIACRYIENLWQLDYQSIGIDFRGYVTLNSDTDSEYLLDNYIKDGPWRQVNSDRTLATLNFTYNFPDSRLSLEIIQGYLQLPESQKVPALLFNGNVARELKEQEASNRYKKLQSIVTNWRDDLETYQNVVNKFINPKLEVVAENKTVFEQPALAN